ncbi:hypothetical protein Lal_00030144 [Lupinus albus]|nr:hypothetical protein Lal_00030144 [Lupinus albus]
MGKILELAAVSVELVQLPRIQPNTHQEFRSLHLSTSTNKPDHVWEETWKWLCDGILYNQGNIANNQEPFIPFTGLVLSDEELQNLTLLEIEKLLQRNRRSLRDYPPMPYPKGYITSQLGNRLIYDELNYDTTELNDNFNLIFQSLTDEQCKIFKTVMEPVNQEQRHMFFLYGYGGTGKTHMWRTLTYALRSQKQIVLTIASSGIVSSLLPGGRTSHSKFKIPVPSLEISICNIHQGSELVGLLKETNHGQLYVAISRVKSKKKLKIVIHDKDGNPIKSTTNVVYKEVFQNL